MKKLLEKYADSYRFWILVIACTYFAYALYYAVSGMRDSIGMTSNQYIYTSLSSNPWWWLVLFYSSEGVAGSIAIIVRTIAGVFAVYAAFLFWRKKDTTIPAIRKSVSTALLLEAIFFLTLIASIIAAAAYNLANDQSLFYFGHTPELLLLYCTLIPCLVIVLVIPPVLLKLRASIKHQASLQEIAKWSSLTGVAYLFVVFWFNYLMMWVGVTVPYTRVYEEYGLSFILQPANLLSFSLTVFGLLALALAALITTLPLIKKKTTQLDLTRIGIILVAFGSYFILNTFYYYLTGGYTAHPSVWYEVLGPLHNPNLWAIAFSFLGVPVLISSRIRKH